MLPHKTTRRVVLERPDIKPKVIALVLAGKSDREVAEAISTKRYHVTHQAVTAWRKRHPEDWQPAIEEAVKQATDYAIAEKVNRIADAQLRRDLLDLVRQARANGGTGIETGIVARTLKVIGSGKNQEVVEEFKVDTAMLAEWRANDKQVAEELGQITKPDIQIQDNRVQVLIRSYKGVDVDKLG